MILTYGFPVCGSVTCNLKLVIGQPEASGIFSTLISKSEFSRLEINSSKVLLSVVCVFIIEFFIILYLKNILVSYTSDVEIKSKRLMYA